MTSPHLSHLTPEQARELTNRGATLLLLDVPVRTQLGFDYLTFTTAAKFKGIKMIPPGPHLIHITPPPATSPHTTSASPSQPSHHWLYLHTSQITVRRFHPPATLAPLADIDSEQRYQLGVAHYDFDSGLGPYQPRSEWSRLSGWVSEEVVVRLEGERRRMEGGWESRWRLEDKFEPRIEEVKEGQEDGAEAERKDERDTKPDRQVERETDEEETATLQRIEQVKAAANTARRQELSQLTEQYTSIYTPLPPLVIPADTSPAAITRLHLDRSHTVQQLLAVLTTRYSHSSTVAFHLLLGELQHSFLSFLVAHDPSAFSYYKHLLTVLSLSSTHFTAQPEQLAALLTVLRAQLNELPADWLNDPLSSDSFMLECVERLLEIADDRLTADSSSSGGSGGSGAVDGWVGVRGESEKVEAVLYKKFGWQRRREAAGVVEDDDEYAPVVVLLPTDDTDSGDAAMST